MWLIFCVDYMIKRDWFGMFFVPCFGGLELVGRCFFGGSSLCLGALCCIIVSLL